MGNEVFLWLFIVSTIIFIVLFVYLLRDTTKKRKEAQEILKKESECMTLTEYFKVHGYTDEQIKCWSKDDKFEAFLYEYCGLDGKDWVKDIKNVIAVIYGVEL